MPSPIYIERGTPDVITVYFDEIASKPDAPRYRSHCANGDAYDCLSVTAAIIMLIPTAEEMAEYAGPMLDLSEDERAEVQQIIDHQRQYEADTNEEA